MPVRPVIGALLAAALLTACTSGGADTRTDPAPSTDRPPSAVAPTGTPSAVPTTAPRATQPSTTARPSATASTRTGPAGAALPLAYSTGTARQVITVVASAESDTQATLQAWRKVSSGWERVGPSVRAWLGTDGMTTRPSEQRSATPMGSYSLTQAFGYDADPGTALPYVQTDPADWWISEPGPLYNTMQRCAADCPFTQGAPNEHLSYETPPYNYAVVIDYNRSPVRAGAGSAIFLHVSVGAPTAGCVSIDQGQLVRILRWLEPGQHPRILIGTR